MGFKDMFIMPKDDNDDEDNLNEDTGLLEDASENKSSRIISRGGTNIARTVSPSFISFKNDYFQLNELYSRVLSFEDWPGEVDPNWLRSLFQWSRAIDISIYYQPLPHKALLNKLRSKSAREQAEIEKDEREGNSVDFARHKRLEDSLDLQEALQRGETKPFQVSLVIAIRAKSKKELDELTETLEKTIDSVGARSRRASLRQRDGFLSVLPFGRNYIADGFTTRNMQTEGAAYTFPLANADLTHPDGLWYGVNLSTNSNVLIDRFKLQSPHSVVFGGSGSGKSYGSKLEQIRAVMSNIPCMVIDPDGECVRLAQYLGGQFITIGPNSPDRINVMDFSYAVDGIEDQLVPKIQSLLKLIGAMTNPDGQHGLNAEQTQILDKLLRQVYLDFGYSSDPRTQINATRERMPVLSDLRARMQQFIIDNEREPRYQQMIQQIVASMGPYCSGGSFESLFDQHTTVDLTADYIVFNIKPLSATSSPHLLALGLHTVLEFIWNTTMNQKQLLSGRPRLLFVDEAHIMMRSKESADFLENMMRRARKCHVGVTILTQDPEDFVRPDRPQGKAILGNSSMQVLLRLKRPQLEKLQHLMGLDDSEIDLLATSNNGEGMIFAMNDRAWLTMHTASPKEHNSITTNPAEVKAILEQEEAKAHARLINQNNLNQISASKFEANQPAQIDSSFAEQAQLPGNMSSQSSEFSNDFEGINPFEEDSSESVTVPVPIRSTLPRPEQVSQIGKPIQSTQPLRQGAPPKPLEGDRPAMPKFGGQVPEQPPSQNQETSSPRRRKFKRD